MGTKTLKLGAEPLISRRLWRICKSLVLLTAVFSSVPMLARGQSAGPLRIAFADTNSPLMYRENGQVKGLYPRIVSAIFEHLNVPIEMRALPWTRALDDAYADRNGLAGVYFGKERAAKLDYSDAMYTEKMLVYVRKGENIPFHSMADLKGKKLALVAGYIYGEEFEQAKAKNLFSLEINLSDDLNFEKLVKGRVDAVIASEIAYMDSARKNDLSNKVVALERPVAKLDTHICFAKGKHKDLIQKVDKTLATMKSDGSLDQIIKTWASER